MAIPQNPLKTAQEVSPLVSPRDGISPLHNWKAIDDGARRASALTNQASLMATRQARPPQSYDVDYGFHPFKVYTIPAPMRQILQPDFDMGTNWRTVRVRGGLVKRPIDPSGMMYVTSFSSGLVAAPGLFGGYDQIGGWEVDFPSECPATLPFRYRADSPFQPEDFTVPEGNARYTIYAELVEYTAPEGSPPADQYQVAIRAGDPQIEGEAWEGAPYGNPYVWPLAIVDTYTWPANYDNPTTTDFCGGVREFAIIRQIQFDHIDLNTPVRFYGDWTSSLGSQASDGSWLPSTGYPLNAIVRKTRGPAVASFRSTTHFNTSDPDSSDTWEIQGEYLP